MSTNNQRSETCIIRDFFTAIDEKIVKEKVIHAYQHPYANCWTHCTVLRISNKLDEKQTDLLIENMRYYAEKINETS